MNTHGEHADERAHDRHSGSQRKMTPAEAGSKGGRVTRDRHGAEFFRRIGQIGGSRTGPPQGRRSPVQNRSADQAGGDTDDRRRS